MLELAVLTIFPAAVAFAGAMDLFTMTIPNRISLVLVASFLVMAPLAGMAPWQMAHHLGAGLVVLAVRWGSAPAVPSAAAGAAVRG